MAPGEVMSWAFVLVVAAIALGLVVTGLGYVALSFWDEVAERLKRK